MKFACEVKKTTNQVTLLLIYVATLPAMLFWLFLTSVGCVLAILLMVSPSGVELLTSSEGVQARGSVYFPLIRQKAPGLAPLPPLSLSCANSSAVTQIVAPTWFLCESTAFETPRHDSRLHDRAYIEQRGAWPGRLRHKCDADDSRVLAWTGPRLRTNSLTHCKMVASELFVWHKTSTVYGKLVPTLDMTRWYHRRSLR